MKINAVFYLDLGIKEVLYYASGASGFSVSASTITPDVFRNVPLSFQVSSAPRSVTAKKARHSFKRAQPASSIHTKVEHPTLTAGNVFPAPTALL